MVQPWFKQEEGSPIDSVCSEVVSVVIVI